MNLCFLVNLKGQSRQAMFVCSRIPVNIKMPAGTQIPCRPFHSFADSEPDLNLADPLFDNKKNLFPTRHFCPFLLECIYMYIVDCFLRRKRAKQYFMRQKLILVSYFSKNNIWSKCQLWITTPSQVKKMIIIIIMIINTFLLENVWSGFYKRCC